MKKTILALAALLMSVSAYAQGQITFNNRLIPNANGVGTYTAGIFLPSGLGAGTAGAGVFTAGLFLASDLNTPLATVTFRNGAQTVQEGFLSSQVVSIPGRAAGQTADLVVRAWLTSAASYSASLTKGEQAFTSTPLGGNISPPTTPSFMTGFTGFTMTTVPEPSVLALGALGAAALLIRRRK